MKAPSIDRRSAENALVKLARQSAATWRAIRGEAFVGEVTVETANARYRFHDGIFSARAPKAVSGEAPAWESPPSMVGVELVGFLANEGGLWSLSPRWRPGSMAVITTRAESWMLTSPTTTIERAAVPAEPPTTIPGVLTRPFSRPANLRPLAPLSMTRIQALPAR